MPVSRFLYLSEKVQVVWSTKKNAVEKNEIYIGGG
jgi:hypothetical protein